MAGKEQQSLIGFDPLAWMDDAEETQAAQEQAISEEVEFASTDCDGVDNETVDQSLGIGAIVLDGVLSIQNVGALYESLRELFEANNKIEIDVACVKVVDTATLQLLIAFKQEAVKLGKEIVFDFPSESFIEAARLLGLDALLGVDQPDSGLF